MRVVGETRIKYDSTIIKERKFKTEQEAKEFYNELSDFQMKYFGINMQGNEWTVGWGEIE